MSSISTGSKIIHKKFGEGVVVSSDVHLVVDFPGSPHVTLQAAWVEANCDVIPPEDDMARRRREAERLKGILEGLAERKFQEILDGFRDFSLPEYGFKEIEDFFRFKLNYLSGAHKKSLRYNLLIQCENDAEAQRFLKKIESGLKKLGALSKKAFIVTESSLSSAQPIGFPRDFSMLGIHDCKSIMKDSVFIMSSSIRANLQLDKQKKDLVWSRLMESAREVPDCTIVAAGPRGFIDYIKESDELYYRFFAHRIFIRQRTVEEIIDAMYRGIRAERLTATEEFKNEIEKYVRVVYPKADLRDEAFVDDLLNRIIVNYYLMPADKKLTEAHVPFYRKPKSFDEISRQLNRLVGLEQVKRQFRQLHMLSLDPMNVNKQRLHFAFLGNPGTGKTTVAKLTAELLFSMGLIQRNKLVMVAPTDVISVYVGESAQLMREKIEEALGGVLFLDEAYFLTSSTSDTKSPQKQCLDLLIQVMENRSDELTVIFAGYSDEMEQMLKSNPGIASRVPYRFVFEDYTNEELLEIFLNIAAKEGMVLEKDAHEAMLDRIALAKTEENFGNARTMATIYQQLKVIWLEQNREERVITAADVKASMPVALNADLDKMIGLTEVKKELRDFESRVRYIKFLQDKNVKVPAPNLHMLFTGNPGTGKTTVARKIADCLYQIGVLNTNKLVVAERKDLVAKFVGETALKTNEVIQKAMNGVLFIDEAYALYRPDSSNDVGTEAIATLITAMENNKGRLVVVFAGYKKEMQVFRNANPGIASRIGFTFHFPDYSPEELTEMFYIKMRNNGFMVDSSALDGVLALMQYFSGMENFGNGRFVDKVIDITINNRSKRQYSRNYNDITGEDVPDIKYMISISGESHALWTDEEQSEKMRWRIAVHEAGHALVSLLCKPPGKVSYVSINADAASQGKTAMEYNEEGTTEGGLKTSLAIKFGGRNAERLVFGEHSAGCAMDIRSAKRLAAQMIDELAVGDFGVTTPVDLLKQADRTATEILKQHLDDLRNIAAALVEEGSISGEKIGNMITRQETAASGVPDTTG